MKTITIIILLLGFFYMTLHVGRMWGSQEFEDQTELVYLCNEIVDELDNPSHRLAWANKYKEHQQ